MSSNSFTIVAQARDEVTGVIMQAANAVDAALRHTKEASEDSAKAQEANLQRLKNGYMGAADTVKNFGELFQEAFLSRIHPALHAAIEIGGVFVDRVREIAGAVFDLAKHAAEAGDSALGTAQRLGVSTEFVTRMGYAAKQSNTSLEAIERGMSKLAQGVNKGSKAFEQYGISLKDSAGHNKSMEQLFLETANVIREIENPVLRLAATQEFFGKGSKELVPLLSMESEAFAELAARADLLGATIDDRTAKAADRLNDALYDMEVASDNTSRKIGDLFVPGIAAGAEGVAEFEASIGYVVETLGTSFREAFNGAGVIVGQFARYLGFLVRTTTDVVAAVPPLVDAVTMLVPHLNMAVQTARAAGAALGFFADESGEAAGAQAALGDEVEQTTEELEKQKELQKTLDKALIVSTRALERVQQEYARKKEAERKKDELDRKRTDKEIDDAMKRLHKAAEAEEKRFNKAKLSYAEDAQRKLNAWRESNAQHDLKISKSRLEDAKRAAKQQVALSKSTSEQIKAALAEDSFAGLLKAWGLYHSKQRALSKEANQEVLQDLQKTTQSMAEEIVSGIESIIGTIRRELDTVGDVQTKTIERIAIKSKDGSGKVERYVDKISKAQIDALRAAGREVEVVNEVMEVRTKTAADAMVAIVKSMVESILAELARLAAVGVFKMIISGLTGGAGGGILKLLGFSKGGIVPDAGIPTPKKFAGGGFVSGGRPGVDSVPAMLMPGEFVLNKKIVDEIRGASPKSGAFATGGLVSGARPRAPELTQPATGYGLAEFGYSGSPSQNAVVQNNLFLGAGRAGMRRLYRDVMAPEARALERNGFGRRR